MISGTGTELAFDESTEPEALPAPGSTLRDGAVDVGDVVVFVVFDVVGDDVVVSVELGSEGVVEDFVPLWSASRRAFSMSSFALE